MAPYWKPLLTPVPALTRALRLTRQGQDPYIDYTNNGICEDGGPGSQADLYGKKGGSGLGNDCTDCGFRYLSPPPPSPTPPLAPPPSPPSTPPPQPMSVQFPLYMFVDTAHIDALIVKLSAVAPPGP